MREDAEELLEYENRIDGGICPQGWYIYLAGIDSSTEQHLLYFSHIYLDSRRYIVSDSRESEVKYLTLRGGQ